MAWWCWLILATGLMACVGESEEQTWWDRAPDFVLMDVNTSSARFGEEVMPRDYKGQVSAWYFGHSNCSICSLRFGELDLIQKSLDADGYDIAILGVNDSGLEAYNTAFCEGRDLPWLQDQPRENVWKSWQAHWRDLFVLDAENELVFRTNLTDNDLSDEANFEALRLDLLDAI